MEKTRKMEKQKESKLNWALTVADSEEIPMSYKISGQQKQRRVWGGEKRHMCSVYWWPLDWLKCSIQYPDVLFIKFLF
jgi:hypothetical protein